MRLLYRRGLKIFEYNLDVSGHPISYQSEGGNLQADPRGIQHITSHSALCSRTSRSFGTAYELLE